MNTNLDKIEDYIKKQSEVFLLEQGAFYPFGCAVNKLNEVKPLGVYIEGENPSVPDLIDLLKNNINKKLNDEEYSIAAIAIDVTIKEANVNIDAIEISFFEKKREHDKSYIKYEIKGSSIEFTSV